LLKCEKPRNIAYFVLLFLYIIPELVYYYININNLLDHDFINKQYKNSAQGNESEKWMDKRVQRFFLMVDKLAENRTMHGIFEVMWQFPDNFVSEYIDAKNIVHKTTYSTYREQIKSAAACLSNVLPIDKRGHFVALKLKNCYEWGVLFWAILMAGYKPVLIDAKASRERTEYLLEQSGAAAIIFDEGERYGLPTILSASITSGFLAHAFEPCWENQIAFCSSGTTDMPQIFVYDGECMSYQIESARMMPRETADIMYPNNCGMVKNLAFLPFHHIFGFVAVFLWYTFFGRTLVYVAEMEPKSIQNTCRRLGVTHIYGVPVLWNSLAKNIIRRSQSGEYGRNRVLKKIVQENIPQKAGQPLLKAGERVVSRVFIKKIQTELFGKSVRYMISGGGYIDKSVLNLINALGYPLYNGYGLTEAGVTSVELTPDTKKRIQGSVGRPLYKMEYDLAPLSGKDRNMGELLIKGNALHKYVIQGGQLIPEEFPDGWMPTGDIARRDKEGRYFIVGRKKDVIINEAGENIYPDELEWKFSELPHIEKVCVSGLSGISVYECIILVLELKQESSETDMREISEKIAVINGTLPLYQKVSRVFVSGKPQPVVNTGKVKRQAIRQEIESGDTAYQEIFFSDDAFWGNNVKILPQTVEKVRQAVAFSLGVAPEAVSTEAHYINDLGGDSLSYSSLIAELEREFGVQIPETLYAKCTNVHEFSLLMTVLS
jgi:acyl carrier protein